MAQGDKKNLSLQIMMLGGRRTGKTSVLASMQGCFNNVFGQTDLTIATASGTTLDIIEEKRREMQDYLALASKNKDFVPDSNPTQGDETYSFKVGFKGKMKDTIIFNFFDSPGEWLSSESERIAEEVAKSDVLMIVLDTPYLMEEGGQYNDRRNCCYRITELVKNNLDLSKPDVPKMVLFVPLKCERYYDSGEMDKVREAITGEDCYGDLINYLSNGQAGCEVAITPILTIGTAVFSRFQTGEDGEYIMSPGRGGYPLKPLYYFTQKAIQAGERAGRGQKYAAAPKYCEQPILYTLFYALTMAAVAAKDKNNKGIGWETILGAGIAGLFGGWIVALIGGAAYELLKTRFTGFASEEDFLKQAATVRNSMVLNNPQEGFALLSDPLKFRGGQ
ncbi:MAG: hypothetical protein IJ849_00645 [Selenomonadaceae bacterium]|nr:hypothetical protein [Selenomonadaceae bacterium]